MHKYPIDGSRDALWMDTAVAAPSTEPLHGCKDCDVAIVGGGLLGLNAALALAQEGKSVIVLEAKSLGFGASGRSGGQVNVGLNLGPKALIATYGQAQAERLIAAVLSTPAQVFAHIKRHGLDCDPEQTGWIQGAVNPTVSAEQSAMAEEYAQFGGDLELLDKASIDARTGSEFYRSGLYAPAAGTLQPLSYTRELARVAMQQGALIHTFSPVTELQRGEDGWVLRSEQGFLRARKVLLASNAYTDGLVHGMAQRVVPVRSILMASEPLAPQLRQSVLPKQVSFVDKRRLILFFRYDRNGRLCAGYHGPMRDTFELDDFRLLKSKVKTIFPQLREVGWDYHWGGRVAMTKSSLPFIAQPLPNVFASMGCNGRGVGMGTVMGQQVAQHLLERDPRELAFPISRPQRFMMHRFHKLGVRASIKLFELQEYLDQLSGRVG